MSAERIEVKILVPPGILGVNLASKEDDYTERLAVGERVALREAEITMIVEFLFDAGIVPAGPILARLVESEKVDRIVAEVDGVQYEVGIEHDDDDDPPICLN